MHIISLSRSQESQHAELHEDLQHQAMLTGSENTATVSRC